MDYKKIKKSLLLCNPYETTEIEIKFSQFGQSFSSITQEQMNRLLSKLNITDKRLITYHMNEQYRKIIVNHSHNDEIKIEKYKTIDYIYNEDYQLHCYITQFTEAEEFDYTMIKNKIEYHYAIQMKNLYKLIISETVVDKVFYEASVKFKIDLLNNSWMTELDAILFDILLILNNTEILYTEPERLDLVNDFNQCFKLSGKYVENILNKPVSIQLEDLKFKEPYIISTKSKGKRHMLMINHIGIWLVNGFDYNLLTRDALIINQAWDFTVFDGEIVKPLYSDEYEFNYQYWYIAYDCLCYNRIDLREKHYIDRIDIAKTFSSLLPWYIDEQFLKYSLKTTRVAQYKEELIEKMRFLLELDINYEHNGLIFTPAYQGYGGVYKWTIPSMITMDFSIYDTGNDTINLYVYDEKTKNDIPFIGDESYRFDETMIFQEPFTKYKNKKYIAECRWDAVMNQMVLIKIRNDKDNADSVRLVLENWKNINKLATCIN